MDFIIPKGIAGKYFINALAAGNGMQALIRGRVLGPIATELSPFYLCDVYPADDDQIGVTTQTIVGLEQLIGVYFYEDREIFDAAWVQINTMLAVGRKKAEADRKAKARTVEKFREMIAKGESGVIETPEGLAAEEVIAEVLFEGGVNLEPPQPAQPLQPRKPRAKRQQKGTGAADDPD